LTRDAHAGRRLHALAALGALLAIALALRVALVAGTSDFAPENDAADYDLLAVSIADQNQFPDSPYAALGSPTALRPPAYPLFLGAVYKVFGSQSWTVGRLAGALLGTLTVLLLYLLARQLWGLRTGLVVAGLAAVYPPLIMVNGSLLSEALFLPLMLGAALAVLWVRSEPGRWTPAIVLGLLCGVAALTRTVGVALLVPAVIGVLMTAGASRGWRARSAAVVVLVAALVIAPWSVRNTVAFDRFVPLSTQGGPTAAGAYNSVAAREGRFWGVWRVPFWLPQFRPLVRGSLDEAEIDSALSNSAKRYAFDHPAYAIRLFGANTLRFFDVGPSHALITRVWQSEMGIPPSLRRVTTISFYVAVGLAAIAIMGSVLGRRLPRIPLFLWLLPLVMYLSVIPIHGAMRYRLPIDPFVLLAGGAGVAALARGVGASPGRTTPTGAGG
jgi:4-amino-4-deoxy-L-arabinose transferase-like glycosyltransferase